MKKCLLLLAIPSLASAQYVYDYTAPIASVYDSPGWVGVGPGTPGSITGEIILEAPLPADGTTTVTPDSARFGINGGVSLSDGYGQFTFTTQHGNVVDSSFDYELGETTVTQNAFSAYSPAGGWTATSAAGGWVDPPAAAVPEIDSKSALAALTLLAGFILVKRDRHA